MKTIIVVVIASFVVCFTAVAQYDYRTPVYKSKNTAPTTYTTNTYGNTAYTYGSNGNTYTTQYVGNSAYTYGSNGYMSNSQRYGNSTYTNVLNDGD